MRLINYVVGIIFIGFFTACSDDVAELKPEEIIESASVLKFSELNSADQEKVEYDCFCHPNNWNQGIKYEKDSTFFVKVRLNNRKLAQLTESNTFSIDDLLSDNPYSLYGKYHNRWRFKNSSGAFICETAKFQGFYILTIDRNGDHDDLIIGPIPEKPSKMIIEINESKNYPGITPKFNL